MSFIEEINIDIDWRMSELASLKTIPLRYNLLPEHKGLLIKYAVPSIYALWEGFVKNTFGFYIKEINKLQIPINEVHIDLLTHTLSSHDKLCLENPRINYKTKKEFILLYQTTISQPLRLTDKLPTKSNVNFDIINDILMRFNLKQLPKNEFNDRLNKLLNFRNKIAHGEKSISVKIEDIEIFSKLVNDLMVETLLRIESGYNSRTFLKTV
ncbi:hypothetical protein AGMMS50262_19090 [Bacteroidia bacterium]|nr:hypothetical protein AGMMS50262_19090 [Bacteroidia bacterium]